MGEIIYGATMHRELVVKQACGLMEPDFPRSGGPIELRRIAEFAEMHFMSIAPDNMSSPITALQQLIRVQRFPISWLLNIIPIISPYGIRC